MLRGAGQLANVIDAASVVRRLPGGEQFAFGEESTLRTAVDGRLMRLLLLLLLKRLLLRMRHKRERHANGCTVVMDH